VTSWSNKKAPVQPNEGNQRKREAGLAMLAAAFGSASYAMYPLSGLEDWMPHTDAVVSR
jgi:hypothetical protein